MDLANTAPTGRPPPNRVLPQRCLPPPGPDRCVKLSRRHASSRGFRSKVKCAKCGAGGGGFAAAAHPSGPDRLGASGKRFGASIGTVLFGGGSKSASIFPPFVIAHNAIYRDRYSLCVGRKARGSRRRRPLMADRRLGGNTWVCTARSRGRNIRNSLGREPWNAYRLNRCWPIFKLAF